MKLIALTILFFLFAFAGCAAVMDTAPREDNPDRASITPGTPTPPTATPLPPDYPTWTPLPSPINPDRTITPTACDIDGCPQPTWTPLPDDWPTPTLNSDQIFLTQWAGTPSQTPDLDDRATHAALEMTSEAGQ